MLRFWGKEIKKDPETCVRIIEEKIFEQKLEETAEMDETEM